MQNVILIPQENAVKNGLILNFTDLFVASVIKYYMDIDTINFIIEGKIIWYHAQYDTILKDFPILDITLLSYKNSILKLESEKIFSKKVINNKMHYAKGANFNLLFYDNVNISSEVIKPITIPKKVYKPQIKTQQDEIDFLEFWNLYDKKVGDMSKIFKKYRSLKNGERLKIIEHVKKYKIAQPNKQYRKNPQTYLNNKSWQDEIIEDNMMQHNVITDNDINNILKID